MVAGKEYRSSLRKPLPNSPKTKGCRYVPAFTIQALQQGTCVIPLPRCKMYKPEAPKPSNFRRSYKRGSLPISKESKSGKVAWKADITKLDFHYYLPIFFEGLCEIENPYKLFVRQGIQDMLGQGGRKIFPCIPQLIIPIKNALKTKNKDIMCATLGILQKLIRSSEMAGQALVPYYRQILPSLSYFKEKNVNCGDAIDYSQMRGDNLADLINETLQLMELYGGEDAFINIKYLIPTYESCMMN